MLHPIGTQRSDGVRKSSSRTDGVRAKPGWIASQVATVAAASILLATPVLAACGSSTTANGSGSTTPSTVASPPTTAAPVFRICDRPAAGSGSDQGSLVCGGCVITASAHCPGADLSRYALGGQEMQNADFKGADFSGANLSQTVLSGANLTGANLTGANLSQADLTRTDLTGANLSGATVDGTYWSATVCPDGSATDAAGGTCVSGIPSPA